MNLAILRGEFSIPSSPPLLTTNILSPLNPLTLRSSGLILAGSINTPLRKPSTKPLNVLRKHFKSRFPAFNIPRQSEEVATDTIFSDTPDIDSGVTIAQIVVGKRTLVTDVYPLKTQKQFVNTLEDNIRFRGTRTKLISDYAKVEISNKVKDILRMYHSSSWSSEPYHQNQNPAEWRYCTVKSWTNTIMNRSGAPADCWLLCMIHASYILNHLSCEALGGNVPLGMLYGVSPDISIIFLYTFYQPVFYDTHNQSYPSASEERAARWVGFGEHVGDVLTHKLLDNNTKKSSTDLLSDPTSIWYLMEGKAPRASNQLPLSGLGKIIVNLLPNPWQNTTQMTLLVGPSYSQKMNKEKGLGPQ